MPLPRVLKERVSLQQGNGQPDGKMKPGSAVMKENPPTYDSQSNGGTEIGIRLVRGMYRTIRLCTESRIGQSIPTDHPLTAWLLQHVCVILNGKVRGKDGRTAWFRVRGRNFGQQIRSNTRSQKTSQVL